MIKLVKAIWVGLLACLGFIPEDCKDSVVKVNGKEM